MAGYIESLRLPVVSISLDKDIVDTQPFIWRKFKVVPKYTYVVNLSGHEEDIKQNFSKEKRNELNKAVKDGVKVSETKEPEDILTLVYKTIERQGIRISERHLRRVITESFTQCGSVAFVSSKHDLKIAGTLFVYDHATMYALLGGTILK